MRPIKFRHYFPSTGVVTAGHDPMTLILTSTGKEDFWKEAVWMQYTGLKDKNGKEIYEGDVLEFADKWEWYKTSYGIKMRFADPERRKELQERYDNEPMERRVIEIPEDYEWLLSSEIQTYWHVIGNIYENPNLIIK